MRTYCVFQKCDKHGYNRLVDRITTSVQDGINRYKSWTRGEVLFLPNCFGYDYDSNVPKNIQFFEPDALTVADIEWLRAYQDNSGTIFKDPIVDKIQRYANKGKLGIFRGICVRVHESQVLVQHMFLVELRHVYDDNTFPAV
ncbi:MAG: hypothetical protein J6S89_09410 [Paludibacteraceae bacterium]|nr:hypothetical protein [Paludibacteraceae bacterium]